MKRMVKTLSVILLAILLSSPVDAAKGDIDRNGTIDLSDAIAAWKIIVGITNNGIFSDVDVNGDNRIGMEEVIYIFETVVKLRPSDPAPIITSFSPNTAGLNTRLTVNGANFLGTTAVQIGGMDAYGFYVENDRTLLVTVGIGATGKISVTTPFGTATSTNSLTYTNLEDKYPQVAAIPINGNSSNTFADGGADQWWKVIVPSDGKLSLTTVSEATLCVIIYLYDQDGTTRLADTYAGGCDILTRTLSFPNLTPGIYYIKANRYSGYGSYTISSQFTSATRPNDAEPNHEPVAALTLPLNGSTTAHLGYYGNNQTDGVDWWKVTTTADGKLSLTTVSDDTLCVIIYLYDQDGTTLLSDTFAGGCEILTRTLSVPNLTPGVYYIKANRQSGYGSYMISSSFTPALLANDSEPNHEITGAMTLPWNGSATAHLGYYGNNQTDGVDWWKVTTTADGKLTLTTVSDDTLCVIIYLYDQDGTTLLSDTFAGGCDILTRTLSFPNLTPGIYYIKANRYSGYGSYTISSQFTSATLPNDTEPNSTSLQAQSLTVPGSATAHLGYYGSGQTDTDDWWAFTTNGGTITLTTVSDNTLCVIMYLYEQDGITELANTYAGSCDILTRSMTKELAAGTYLIKANRYRGFGSYSITGVIGMTN